MERFFTILFCTIALIVSAIPTHATEAVVAVDHYPPWKIINGNNLGGIDTELIEALLKEVEVEPNFVNLPWSRALAMLKTGEVDMLTGVFKRPEREKYLYFIEPAYKTHSSKTFYIRSGSLDIRTYEDLLHKTIGIQRGATYFSRFDTDPALEKQKVTEDSLNFRKLAQGRVDVVITTESQGDYLVATLGLSNIIKKCTYRYDKAAPVYFVLSKKSLLASIRPALEKAAKRLKDNGTFERIIKNYFKTLTSDGLPLAD